MSPFCINENLDEVRLAGMYGTAQFLPGIQFTFGEPFFVTQDDLQTPLFIDPGGDWLYLEQYLDGYGWMEIDFWGLAYGENIAYGSVGAPVGEESIAWQMFWIYQGEDQDFWQVKELPNTIGTDPFQVSKRATFSGYVKERNGNPIPNVLLHYCQHTFYEHVPMIYTDDSGYFHTDNMYCKNYSVDFLVDENSIGDTTICIEPDSVNYFEFILDTLLTTIHEKDFNAKSYSITCFPNPATDHITFAIEAGAGNLPRDGIIKIINSEGFIADLLPVNMSSDKQTIIYGLQERSIAAGTYFYHFEIAHQRKASGKMIVIR
jgi:hypothetical protein